MGANRHWVIPFIIVALLAIGTVSPLQAQDTTPEEQALELIEEAADSEATELDLSGLNLTILPPDIGQLNNLQLLALGNNALTELPPEIGQLTNLRVLNLEGNDLTELPPELGNLDNLDNLVIRDNPLSPEYPTDTQELLQYLRQQYEFLNNLVMSGTMLSATLQMQPGETRTLSLGFIACCYIFEPVSVNTTWLVEPEDGATIDPSTGELAIDPGTSTGSVFTVHANVENGRRIISVEIHIYTPEAEPLIRIWSENAQLACDSDVEIAPIEPIRELIFRADGTFSVTWTPFEVYFDYWGNYTYDPVQETLSLSVGGGNYLPDDVDLSGTVEFDGAGRLLLMGMWLGTRSDSSAATVDVCGQRFE